MIKALLVDIDQTISNCEHRLHHITGSKKDFDKFNSLCSQDEPIRQAIDIVNSVLDQINCGTIFCRPIHNFIVTGRTEKYRKETVSWLYRSNVQFDTLIMRPNDNKQPAQEFKRDVYLKRIKGKYDVLFAIDDNPKVIKVWKELGLFTLQV